MISQSVQRNYKRELVERLVKPSKTAVIVIDPQVDYCAPQGSLVKYRHADVKPLAKTMKRLDGFLTKARAAGVQIVWTRMNEDPKYLKKNISDKIKTGELWKKGTVLCSPGKRGFEYYLIRPKQGDKEFVKKFYDAFTNKSLHAYLRKKGISNIIFTGGFTARCVHASVNSAFNIGYNCVVVRDFVWSYPQDIGEQVGTLNAMDANQAYVIDSETILRGWHR